MSPRRTACWWARRPSCAAAVPGSGTGLNCLWQWQKAIGDRASALLTRLIEAGKAAGVTAFTLEVRADNAAAIHLYEKLGFRTAGRLERYLCVNGEYCAALVMELCV